MAHPQSSPRGFVSYARVDVGGDTLSFNSTSLQLSGGLALSGITTTQITQDSTGTILAGSLTLSGKSTAFLSQDSTSLILAGDLTVNNVLNVNGDSTGILLISGTDTAGLAGNIAAGNVQIGTNSTGATFIAVRTTGTTWKFLNVTTVLPT